MTEGSESAIEWEAASLAGDKATHADEFQAIGSQIPEDELPTHTDLLEDDDFPGLYWRHTYPMYPVVTYGVITAWQCDGCGYEQAARPPEIPMTPSAGIPQHQVADDDTNNP